jgi:hypothetical protein
MFGPYARAVPAVSDPRDWNSVPRDWKLCQIGRICPLHDGDLTAKSGGGALIPEGKRVIGNAPSALPRGSAAMKAHSIALLLAGLCFGGLLPSLAWAQSNSATPQPGQLDASPIGKVLNAAGTARIEHAVAVVVQANLPPSGSSQAKVGDLVYRGDVIETGVDGALGIAFADGSSFSVSNNARMEVNEFLYDPKGNSNSTLLSLTKGTFTFIAGNVAHTGDMKVDTPVGTLGIRGTAPRVEISNDGSVRFSTLIEAK